ncbi:MAG: hypothetical protein ABFE08_10020 [Armatimonadia bacterium]
MRASRLITLLVLCCWAGAASALPLGALWPWEAATHATGWRFRQDFISWPGDYWRGPSAPPTIGDPNDHTTWGTLRLGGKFDPPPPVVADAHEVIAPLFEGIPIINGAIGYDEWSGAAQIVQRQGEGEELVLLAEHTDYALYVAVALPSLRTLRQGQAAELYLDLEPDRAGALNPQQLKLRAIANRSGNATLEAYSGGDGRWSREPVKQLKALTAESSQWRAQVATAGDGAWQYVVAEFAIPYRDLFGANCPPEKLGIMARMQSEAGGKRVVTAIGPRREAVYWPDSRNEYDAATDAPLSIRPDSWGALILSATDPRYGLPIPCAKQKVKVDGQLGVKEWKDASRAEYVFPGDQWRVMLTQQDDSHVYFAVRMRAARGSRLNETCGLYLDPCGDGGLRPRSDDVMYRLPLGVATAVEALSYQDSKWRPVSCVELQGASYPLNAYESCYEFAVPRAVMKGPQPPNLAVEVSYELEPH